MGSISLKLYLDLALKVERFCHEKLINQNSRGKGPATADRWGGGGQNARLWKLGQGQVLKGLTIFFRSRSSMKWTLTGKIYTKYLGQALKVELLDFSQQTALQKKSLSSNLLKRNHNQVRPV